MRFAHTSSGRPADKRFHERRKEARKLFLREDEASNEDQVAYAIDEDNVKYPLGGLPSGMRDENYNSEDSVSGEHFDYRDAHPYF